MQVIVTIGVALASYGEIRFVILGVILQVCATVLESTRLILVQVLLQVCLLFHFHLLTLHHSLTLSGKIGDQITDTP